MVFYEICYKFKSTFLTEHLRAITSVVTYLFSQHYFYFLSGSLFINYTGPAYTNHGIKLTCQTNHISSKANIVWYRNNKKLGTTGKILEIPNNRFEQQGSYHCTVLHHGITWKRSNKVTIKFEGNSF